MKTIGLVVAALVLMSAAWLTDFEKAKEKARDENKLILIYFSGDDWCYTCEHTRKAILEKDVFNSYADANLVFVNADFPRLYKSSMSKEQAKANKALADKYNQEMVIPAFVAIDADGNLLKKWQGNISVSADEFIRQIRALQH
jgi:thioredoxin-related protein